MSFKFYNLGGGGGAAAETVDVVAGETLAAGQVVFLDAGAATQGRAYLADADDAYRSTRAAILGIVTVGAAAGATATIQTSGTVSGLSGLTADLVFGLSSTPGALAVTASAPWLGVATSATELKLSGLHSGGLTGLTAGAAYKSNGSGALVAVTSGSSTENAIGYAISATSIQLRSRFGSTAPLATVWSGPAPLAYYRWDASGSGATATDSSGNGYDATMPAGSFNYVAADGSGSVPAIGSYTGDVLDYTPVFLGGIPLPTLSAAPGSTTSGSLAMWLLPNTTTTNEYIYSGAKAGSSLITLTNYWSSNKFRCGGLSSATSGDTSAWQHWVWTRNGTDYRIYLNGNPTPDAAGASTSAERSTTSQWLFCAYTNRSASLQYDGYAKDYTLFDAELTPAQVTELYNGGTPLSIV